MSFKKTVCIGLVAATLSTAPLNYSFAQTQNEPINKSVSVSEDKEKAAMASFKQFLSQMDFRAKYAYLRAIDDLKKSGDLEKFVGELEKTPGVFRIHANAKSPDPEYLCNAIQDIHMTLLVRPDSEAALRERYGSKFVDLVLPSVDKHREELMKDPDFVYMQKLMGNLQTPIWPYVLVVFGMLTAISSSYYLYRSSKRKDEPVELSQSELDRQLIIKTAQKMSQQFESNVWLESDNLGGQENVIDPQKMYADKLLKQFVSCLRIKKPSPEVKEALMNEFVRLYNEMEQTDAILLKRLKVEMHMVLSVLPSVGSDTASKPPPIPVRSKPATA